MKFILKLTLYQLVYYAVRCVPVHRRGKQLLLIKTDEIGDYMLIRNLLPLFKKSNLYSGYKITLVANTAYRKIFELYDKDAVDEVIWMDKKRYKADLVYRFRFLRQIRRIGVSDAISLIYSRLYRLEDVIMAVCGAVNRIGMNYDDPLIHPYERWLTPGRLYTHLEETGERTLFESVRNARFISQLLELREPSASTAIEAPTEVLPFSLPAGYFVIFPGSGDPERRWPPAYFSVVAHHLADRYRLVPVVCGTAIDIDDCRAFVDDYAASLIDLTGKTTLPQMLSILKGAACLISVDTGAVHLAAAVQCPVFGVFSGRYYGRFSPYPHNVAPRFYPVYPDEIDELLVKNISFPVDSVPVDLLKNIPPEKIVASIDAALVTSA